MHFKQDKDGNYHCSFSADKLPTIIRLVHQGETWKVEEAEKARDTVLDNLPAN